jgi:hypothetical protein
MVNLTLSTFSCVSYVVRATLTRPALLPPTTATVFMGELLLSFMGELLALKDHGELSASACQATTCYHYFHCKNVSCLS